MRLGKFARIRADFDVFLVKLGFQVGGFGAHGFQLDRQLTVKIASFAPVGTQGSHTALQRSLFGGGSTIFGLQCFDGGDFLFGCLFLGGGSFFGGFSSLFV